MEAEEFLRWVLPATGPYLIAYDFVASDGEGKIHKNYKQFSFESTTAAAEMAMRLMEQQRNAFFGVGALKKSAIYDTVRDRMRVSRSGDNIRALQCFVMDLDVGDGKQYATFEDAVEALRAFVKVTRMPRPMLVRSGQGVHVYWRVNEEVEEAEWEAQGAKLKALAVYHGMAIDPSRTGDSSSVLRVVGTLNFKYDPPLPVEIVLEGTTVPKLQLYAAIDPSTTAGLSLPSWDKSLVGLGTNTDKASQFARTELDFRQLLEKCQRFRMVAEDPTGTTEPVWSAAIQLCAHTHNGLKAAHWISKDDPRYKPAEVDLKVQRLIDIGIGATRCDTFQKLDRESGHHEGCLGCPSYGKLTSPAQIAHYFEPAQPAAEIEAEAGEHSADSIIVLEPPWPYQRTAKGIGYLHEDAKSGAEKFDVFCPYDMYPVKMRHDERTKLAATVHWKVRFPKEGWQTIEIEQNVSRAQLQSVLASNHVLIDEHRMQLMGKFMYSYMRRLQEAAPREVAFAHYGWRDDGSFVLGDTLYRPDGGRELHSLSRELLDATAGGVKTAGSLNEWKRLMQFYNQPGLEAYRCYLYSSFGSIFYSMTGQIATCVCATGATGIGKSTLLRACASVWGDPSRIINGAGKRGATMAASEILTQALYNLPLLMDDSSDQDAKQIAEFIFAYTSGRGRARARASGGLRGDTATWSNLAISNSNADEYDRMATVNRDGAQHMVRLVQLQFEREESITKEQADPVSRAMYNHYGHAGHAFVEFAVRRREKIRERVALYDQEASAAASSPSEERFWTAWVACARAAGEIAAHLGLLEGFPIAHDVGWMYGQLERMRAAVKINLSTPTEILAEFLNASIDGTLRMSSKAGNVNNIQKEPRGDLTVRHELDTGIVTISTTALRTFCSERAVNYTQTLAALYRMQIIKHGPTLRTLGAQTPWATGQIRCIVLDLARLEGKPVLVASHLPLPATGTP